MPKAIDVAYVVYQTTELAPMRRFMEDFGLRCAEQREDALFMRAALGAPYVHVTRLGQDNRFIGAGLRMASRADLDALARLPGSSPVEPIEDAPGGGWRVRMRTPDGAQIDAVWGQQEAELLPLRAPNPFNAGQDKRRLNASLRPKREPGLALRLGHFVLRVSDHDRSLAWFTERFGMLPSDRMLVPGNEEKVIGTFLRCDRGETPVDHHSMLVVHAEQTGAHHCSFEFQDLDAVMGAHDYLVRQGWKLDCGVGRHLIGSQIFDYWRDPFGNRVEHYTDGDCVDHRHEAADYAVPADKTTQWGMDPSPEFFD